MNQPAPQQPKLVGKIEILVFDNGQVSTRTPLTPNGTMKAVGLALSSLADMFHRQEQEKNPLVLGTMQQGKRIQT